MALTRPQLAQLARHHAAVEAAGDVEATLATLTADPLYLLPAVGKRFSGLAMARRWYEQMVAEFQPLLAGGEMLAEWEGEDGLVQEYKLTVRHADRTREHHVIAVLTFGENALSGERIYADDTLLRAMAGPLWDELEPL